MKEDLNEISNIECTFLLLLVVCQYLLCFYTLPPPLAMF